MKAPSSSTRSSLALAAVFLGLHLARAPFHELWRDEWHSWLTAVASPSPVEVAWSTRFDGHPLFWPLLVWCASRVLESVWVMQALHAVIAAAAAFVVLRWAPFPRWLCVLFLCGYFPFFEYAVISRGYALSMLMAAICCALMSAGRLRPLALGAALGLLAWSTFYGALLALALLAVLVFEAAAAPSLPATRQALRRHVWIAVAVGAGAMVLAILDAVPAAGGGGAPPWSLRGDTTRALRGLSSVFRGLVPVPRFGPHFWNTNVLDGHVAAGLLGAVFVPLPAVLLRRRSARLLWAVAVAAVLAFSYTKFWGALRHHGFYWLALASACWIAAASNSKDEPWPAWRRRLAAGVLALHLLVAGYATVMDLRRPFSASVETARWLRTRGLANLPIVAERDTRVSPLSGLLERPLFYVRGRRWGTFVIFDAARARDPSSSDILESALALETERDGPVLIILSDAATRTPPAGFELLASFTDAIEASETYVVYARPESAAGVPPERSR